jgi:c-di-GMP-binding flagellar brake protein YcgR
MSEQGGVFWRRLDWRLWRQSYIAHTPAAERLAWIYRPDMETATVEEPRTLAQVLDISLGGLTLAASRSFDSGTLLRIEGQGGGGERPVGLMARVIQVAPRSAGNHVLSCCFAKELSDEELQFFGAERRRPEGRSDVRAWVRYPCTTESIFHSVLSADQERCRAKVLNISAGGVALLSPRKLESGTLLNIDLIGSEGRPTRTLKARVVHEAVHADNQYVLGCTFVADLSDDDVMALL